MQYVIYVLIKLACYTAWCWLGLRLWHLTSSGWLAAIGFGLLRLGIGIVFGIGIFFIIPVQADNVLWMYLTIYTLVLLVESLILAWILRPILQVKNLITIIIGCSGCF